MPLRSSFGEVGRKAVKIVLSPDFKRMVMALGTFESDAEKQLTDDGGEFIRSSSVAIQSDRSFAKCAALSRQQFTSKLVPRPPFPERLSNEVIVVQDCLDSDAIRIWPQQVHPFVGPVIRKIRFLQKSVHEL